MPTTICSIDNNLVFTGDVATQADKLPIPRGWVSAEKPQGEAKYWQWQSTRWVGLDEYPPSPPPPDPQPKWYSPDKIILSVDAMGKSAELEHMLLNSSPRIRLRWQKAILFDGSDADFISLVDALQAAWGLTDEQRAAFLAGCETQPYGG